MLQATNLWELHEQKADTQAGVTTMAAWEYKVTNHVMDELKKCIESKTTRPVISCDSAGGCMVNDVCALGTDTLASALNELGKEGWELIITNYHHGELLSIWKRQK